MDPAIKQALKDLAHLIVDKELGPVLSAEIAKLPATYGPIVGMLEQAALPAIVAALDKAIDGL